MLTGGRQAGKGRNRESLKGSVGLVAVGEDPAMPRAHWTFGASAVDGTVTAADNNTSVTPKAVPTPLIMRAWSENARLKSNFTNV